jgi:hypothetical protein
MRNPYSPNPLHIYTDILGLKTLLCSSQNPITMPDNSSSLIVQNSFTYFFVCMLIFHSDKCSSFFCTSFYLWHVDLSFFLFIHFILLLYSSLYFILFYTLFFSYYMLFFWVHLNYTLPSLPSSSMHLCCALLLYLGFLPKLYPKTVYPTHTH